MPFAGALASLVNARLRKPAGCRGDSTTFCGGVGTRRILHVRSEAVHALGARVSTRYGYEYVYHSGCLLGCGRQPALSRTGRPRITGDRSKG
jgi:hypothetical protein